MATIGDEIEQVLKAYKEGNEIIRKSIGNEVAAQHFKYDKLWEGIEKIDKEE